MGLFSRIRHAVQAAGQAFRVDSVEDSAQLAEYLRGGGVAKSGQAVGSNAALSVAAFYRGVNLLAGLMASAPIDVVETASFRKMDSHHVVKLLRRKPNRWQTAHEFRRYLSLSTILRGNGYALKNRSRIDGTTIGLIPIDPDTVTVRQLPDLSIEYDLTRRDGRRITVPGSDMLHLRGMTLDGVIGVSVLTYARETLGVDLAARERQASFFRNGVNVGSVLETDQPLSTEAQDRLRDSMTKYRQGQDRDAGTLVLEQGTKFRQMGISMKDAEFIDQRKLGVQEICMFLGIQPHLLGFSEGNTALGSSIEHQSIGFHAYTMTDWFEMWEGAIERDLLGRDQDQGYSAEFDAEFLLRADLQSMMTAYTRGVQFGVLNPDEVRAKLRMPTRPGGDQFVPPPNMTAPSGDS